MVIVSPHERIRAAARGNNKNHRCRSGLFLSTTRYNRAVAVIAVDDIIFFNEKNNVPNEVSVQDTAVLEQLKLINELDNEEKNILLKLIETFVSKKRFKDYLQKNIAAL